MDVKPLVFRPSGAGFLRFVQWDSFVQDWRRLGLDDDDLRALEAQIMADPRRAPVIAGTGGVRKLRFAPEHWRTGKSGAIRVGYTFFESHHLVLLLVAYGKREQDNLSPQGKQSLRNLITEIQRHLDRTSRHGT